MGAQLVGQAVVFAARADLKHTEARLLNFMALTALDSGTPPTYFAARESSALALGRIVPDQPNADDPDREDIEKSRAAAFEAVRVATQGLVRTGAIRNVRRGREGQRAEYALTLGPVENLEGEEDRGRKILPLGPRKILPLRSRKFLDTGAGNSCPQGTTEEPLQEQHPGRRSPRATTSPVPVENSQRIA